MVNADGEAVYCKFHYKSDQGIKCFDRHQADEKAKTDPDHAIRDLYNAIAEGNFPTWTMSIQVMTFKQAENWAFNPFDLTKVWPHGEFPLIPVGKITLNRNPRNYFAEVEQIAFSPAHLVPGIEPRYLPSHSYWRLLSKIFQPGQDVARSSFLLQRHPQTQARGQLGPDPRQLSLQGQPSELPERRYGHLYNSTFK